MKIEQMLQDPEFAIKIFEASRDECRMTEIAELMVEPKADAISSSQSDISISEMAKILNKNGFKIGRDKLFTLLRMDGYLFLNSDEPKQVAINKGILKVAERSWYNTTTDVVEISHEPVVTTKGQKYFLKKYCDKDIDF